MQTIQGRVVYSATDLVGYLECNHLPNLERAALEGFRKRPDRDDPVLDRLGERGRLHEQRFLADRQFEGRRVATIEVDETLPRAERYARAAADTLAAMRAGAEVIYQAVLLDDHRLGFADFLQRVEEPSDLGEWSYEVWDTKLARKPKASAVLQLCMYSDLLGSLQGAAPRNMHLALGGVAGEVVPFRVADYAAYYRWVAREFEAMLGAWDPADPVPTKPDPVAHCDICRWTPECKAELRAVDDLSLVAGITSRQRRALREVEVGTLTALAGLPVEAEPRPAIRPDSLTRIREQARIQVEGERAGRKLSERIPHRRDREGALLRNYGLSMLPAPSVGDLFFDIEGDPFFGTAEADGIDYLFGVIEPSTRDAQGVPRFRSFWSIDRDGHVTPAAERTAFEALIDLVMARLAADPGMHVYHYAPYETTAVKRLAARHGTREEEVDRLLRGAVFVDLHRAVRQGIRASVESYSIKRLEPLYEFERAANLRDANSSIIEFETWLELGGTEGDDQRAAGLLAEIEAYNRDDCLSTWRLRDWLETQRAALEGEMGEALPRGAPAAEPDREPTPTQRERDELAARLTEGAPDALAERTTVQQARWLLAQLLNWHRREDKSSWWRFFFLKNELTDEERREESDALGELTFESKRADPAPRARSMIYRFRFPPQEHKIGVGAEPRDPNTDEPFGEVVGEVFAIDNDEGWIEFRRGNAQPAPNPTALVPYDAFPQGPRPAAIARIAAWVLEHDIGSDGDHRAARDLLLRTPPRLGQAQGAPLALDSEDPQAAAQRLAVLLDGTYLAIQGPPGSGKTTVGAEMILDLVAARCRVGVTGPSHKVIGNLLAAVDAAARKRGVTVRIGQKPAADEPCTFASAIELSANRDVDAALDGETVDIIGGTAWLWSRPEVEARLDVLVVDEAGQMSLADTLASSTGARSLILLGDPQQLDQPLQGVHPAGAERSALAHLLGDHRTMPRDLGLFLDGTWRLHPQITTFTSEVFYDGLLHSQPGRERQTIAGTPPLTGTGLRFIAADHALNSSKSPEEVESVAGLVSVLLESGATWTNDRGEVVPMTAQDVLVITPYNAQVRALQEALASLNVGTVDKFQGQQAPVSIYSMATSSAEEAPRGLEFLYSLNRLNVATSRARCLAVVVASPGLLHVRCRTPRQMQLVNALARFVELASEAAAR